MAYGAEPPDLYAGAADYPLKDADSNGVCTVTISHERHWDRVLAPPRNNFPHEKSLYPGDAVDGLFTRTAENCCGVTRTGPTAVGDWSELTSISGGSYTQNMKILQDRPTPGSSTSGGYLQTAEYDNAGRSRTHWLGTVEGYGQTTGAKASISGGRVDPHTGNCVDRVTASITTKFVFRNPFWETSIHEHHILDANGYPASNLDYSNYRYDAIPLEAGSNLVLGAYRWETIEISHEILSGGIAAEKFHCRSKTCDIDLPASPESASYVGHMRYQGDAKNPPWHGPDPGREDRLDYGEAIFSIPATASGEMRIMATMTNNGIEVARGYNTTYQFVPSYEPVMLATPVTNTALGGNSALDRPVSMIIKYNGTISDTLHYCVVGDAYDTNGTLIPHGSAGSVDAWGRAAGAACPETGAGTMWGDPGACGTPGCTYTAHPEPPAATGWGRWSSVNPETRALLEGFVGEHVVCPTGPDAAECVSYETPYLNWDFVPGTDRDFVPACVVDAIAAGGGPDTNRPKPDDWGLDGDWWLDGPYAMGEGAEPHSYRGIFAARPDTAPTHYVVDSGQCEYELGNDRDCVPRGSECKPEYDRRCESVFEPYSYPDDYIMSGHQRLQEMVVEWCGPSPAEQCAREAYGVIDDVMVSLCMQIGIDYGTRSQVIDAGSIAGGGSVTPNMCHNMVAVGVHAPAIGGVLVDDWRGCYGDIPPETEPPSVWPDGKPDVPPACHPQYGGTAISQPHWDGSTQNVYVPYTPTTGAFAGVVERPGNMLLDDGTLTCSCEDLNNNSICDRTEAGAGDPDLDGNGIIDDWDTLTVDGAVKCLDRSGTAASAVAACWAKYGRGVLPGGEGSGKLGECLAEAGKVADGPDGECNPAVVIGRIAEDGSVDASGLTDPEGLGRSVAEFVSDPDLVDRLAVPFQAVGGIIPLPYVVDGKHIHCDESEPWCVSAGDTYLEHERRSVCQDPSMPASVKRIPAPATMPPLYQPIFDELWPPECLPKYPVGNWSRPDHPVSLDQESMPAVWPTAKPGSADRTPSHVGVEAAGSPPSTTMMLHAGTGVVRFAACADCEAPETADGHWSGNITSSMGGGTFNHTSIMQHPPFVVNQQGTARVIAVEPCDACPEGWKNATGAPGVNLVLTAYPEMRRPVTEPYEMAAHACQVDGDGGTGPLNIAGPAGQFSSWLDGALGMLAAPFGVLGTGLAAFMEFWNEMSCRDGPGISITIQDYEAARNGAAAKRESGQPWTVSEGINDVSVDVFRNGIWLNTLSILEHRGQCITYTWSPGVTPGHTSCPATSQDITTCMGLGGDMQWCMERYAASDICSNVFVEDGIHKKWEFTENEYRGMINVRVDAPGCAASLDAEAECSAGCDADFESCAAACAMGEDGCLGACAAARGACASGCSSPCIGETRVEYSACGAGGCAAAMETILRMPDGSYARHAGSDPDAAPLAVPAADLEWAAGGAASILLGCEAAVGDDGKPAKLVRDVPAADLDFNKGGSFACQAVQACDRQVTNYKCLGGEVVKHVVCEEPADSFSVLDMPYEEVMGSVGPQFLHIEAVCPASHPLAGPDSPGCDGRPVYNTHRISEGADFTLVYVDYHGVGELRAGRDDPSSRIIHLRPPETFGRIHDIVLEWEGGSAKMTPKVPCTVCSIDHAGDAIITVQNVYGATLTTDLVSAEPPRVAVIQSDEITGALWLYLPALLAGAVVFVVIKKYKKHLGIWDEVN